MEVAIGGESILLELVHVLQNVQISKYVVVASLCILTYDHILTLADEIKLVWPSRWGAPKVLFFLNRYVAYVDPILLLIELLFGGGATFCVRNFQILGAFSSYGFIIAQIILMMRAWAIWERGVFITTILSVLLLLGVTADVFVLKQYLSGIQFVPPFSSAIKGCLLTFNSRIVYVDFILVMVTETIMLMLLATKAVQHFRHSRSTLMVRMYADGVFYYIFIVVTSIANLVTILIAPIELHNFLIVTQRCIHSILCSRVLLHIRGAYNNRAQVASSERRQQTYSLEPYGGRRRQEFRLPRSEGYSIPHFVNARGQSVSASGVWTAANSLGSRSDVLLSVSFATDVHHHQDVEHDFGVEGDKDAGVSVASLSSRYSQSVNYLPETTSVTTYDGVYGVAI